MRETEREMQVLHLVFSQMGGKAFVPEKALENYYFNNLSNLIIRNFIVLRSNFKICCSPTEKCLMNLHVLVWQVRDDNATSPL